MLLQQRDLAGSLRVALIRSLEAADAEAGALYLTAQRPWRVRMGRFPAEADPIIERWETLLEQRNTPASLFEQEMVQVSLASGQALVRLGLMGAEGVVGQVVLLLTPGAHLSTSQIVRLRTISHLAGNLSTLLHDLSLTQQRLERLGLLYDIGQALASTLDLQQLLQDTMQLAANVMNAQASSLMLVDPEDSNFLIFEVAHGSKGEQLRRSRISKQRGIAGWVATHAAPVISNNPMHDERFNRTVDLRTGFLTRNILCVPMQIKGVVVGVLQVLNKAGEQGFDEEDMELLLTLASQAAVAIDNARLYRNLREEQERIIAAQEEVRRELARTLHDGTVQQLAIMGLQLEHIKQLLVRRPDEVPAEVEELIELNSRAIRDARTLLFELRPVILETQGLGPALITYIERLNKERGFATPVRLVLPTEMPPLSSHVARTLFAIIQEAVGNARKHARASEIVVRAVEERAQLALVVEDDGAGFDPAALHERYDASGSLGMINMRERAELINATWLLESTPGQGTCVTVRVPLDDGLGVGG